jgi:heme-degrading monooxygenase HmoA
VPTLTSRTTPQGHPATAFPETEAIVFASKLPLRSRLAVPGFLRDTLRIRRQLDGLLEGGDDGGAGGLLWYALRADVGANVYWTASAWRSNADLAAFVRADPHDRIMRDRRGTLGGFVSARWTVAAADLPLEHSDIVDRLAAAN